VTKLFFPFITLATLFFASCNNSKVKVKANDKIEVRDEEKRKDADNKDAELLENKTNPQTTEVVNDDDSKTSFKNDIEKIADAYCDCVNRSLAGIDPIVKKIFTKLVTSNNPKHFFQYEVERLNEDEKKQFSSGVKELGGHKEIVACKENLQKKYGISKDEESEMRIRIFEVIKDKEECQVVAGFLRMKIVVEAEKEQKKKTKDD